MCLADLKNIVNLIKNVDNLRTKLKLLTPKTHNEIKLLIFASMVLWLIFECKSYQKDKV